MAICEIDQSLFPIVILKVSGELTFQEHTELLQLIEQLLENSSEPIYLLCNLSQAAIPELSIRTTTSHWLQDNEDLVKDKVKEFIFVHQSTLMMMMLKAIFTLSPLPVSNYTSTSIEQGINWARQRMLRVAS